MAASGSDNSGWWSRLTALFKDEDVQEIMQEAAKVVVIGLVDAAANKLAKRYNNNPVVQVAAIGVSGSLNVYGLAKNGQKGYELVEAYLNDELLPRTSPNPDPNPSLEAQVVMFCNRPAIQATVTTALTGRIVYGLTQNYQDACVVKRRYEDVETALLTRKCPSHNCQSPLNISKKEIRCQNCDFHVAEFELRVHGWFRLGG